MMARVNYQFLRPTDVVSQIGGPRLCVAKFFPMWPVRRLVAAFSCYVQKPPSRCNSNNICNTSFICPA